MTVSVSKNPYMESSRSKLSIPTRKALQDRVLSDAEREGIEVEVDSQNKAFLLELGNILYDLQTAMIAGTGFMPDDENISEDGMTQGVKPIHEY